MKTPLRIIVALAVLCVGAFQTEVARGAELAPAPEGTFSIAVLPDTQHYRGRGSKHEPESTADVTNPVFEAYTQWIADNLERQRIVFVSHVGDIVDINESAQWQVARRCMDRFHGRAPYGIAIGNHDMTSEGVSSLFQEYFPQSRFEGLEWYGGAFQSKRDDQSISGNNANSYQLFAAEGYDFIILHLECNAPDDVLHWANDVLAEHSDRRAIVTTHMYLGPRDYPQDPRDYFDAPKDLMLWTKRHGDRGNNARHMWEECFSKHENLFMVFCGDQSRTQAMHQTARGKHGNPVHAVLSDYGVHGLRIYRFAPNENLIYVQTYNPIEGKLCEGTEIVPDRGQHQFTLSYDMSPKMPRERGEERTQANDTAKGLSLVTAGEG